MRISKLSARAGLPVGTVKFYLRTGLLHSGLSTSATQALYDETHVARLRLIRALLEVGGLSLAEIHRIVDAEAVHRDDPELGMNQLHEALSGRSLPAGSPELASTHALLADLGWDVDADSPHPPLLARALQALASVGLEAPLERMKVYADAAAQLAHEDHAMLAATAEQERPVTLAASTVLFDAVLVALRRLAGESLRNQQEGGTTRPRMAMPAH